MASFSCSINDFTHVSIFPGILRSLYVSIVWPGFAPCTARLQCRRVMLLFVDYIQQNMPTVLLCLIFFWLYGQFLWVRIINLPIIIGVASLELVP